MPIRSAAILLYPLNRAAGLCAAALLLTAASPLIAQTPISAIDWLDQRSLTGRPALPRSAPDPSGLGGGITAPGTIPSAFGPPTRGTLPGLPATEPPVAQSVTVPEVTTQPLDAPQIAAVGLLPKSVTGLPETMWQGSSAATLGRKLARLDIHRLPAMQSLLYTLVLAEAEPPAGAGNDPTFLLARIDKLTEMGAVEPAEALIERAGPETHPGLFSRWFDLAMLAGSEDAVCEAIKANPALAPTPQAQVFCQARTGDWDLAALTLRNSAVLELIPAAEANLLELFLDPALTEGAPPMPPPAQMTPLVFRLSEAIGTPLPSAGLPRAYAQADLRGISGWRAEIEAAERLARAGALSENRLLGIYTDRKPAASGGLWDRVAAIQALDEAISAGDAAAVGAALPPAWSAIREAELEVPFARLWGTALAGMPLEGRAARIAFDVALLSPEYESLAGGLTATTARDRFLLALARGEPDAVPAPDGATAAIARAFADAPEIPGTLRLRLTQGQLGEAMLDAMGYYARGVEGETKDITAALAALRMMGLENAARRAGLELVLLERRL